MLVRFSDPVTVGCVRHYTDLTIKLVVGVICEFHCIRLAAKIKRKWTKSIKHLACRFNPETMDFSSPLLIQDIRTLRMSVCEVL